MFGTFTAVDGVDLQVERDELHAIIGPNGAGKTTLFSLITGSLSPTAGTITFDQRDITDADEDSRARGGILRAFQITQLFPESTVRENVRIAAQSRGQRLYPLAGRDEEHDATARELLDDIGLADRTHEQAKFLSHGDKKKLEIAMSLAADPELLLLDEPTSGVSGAESEWIFSFIDDVAEDVTVLLIEHDVDLVLEVSDTVTVLHQGAVLARGSPDEIAGDEAVQRAYLGGY
jgi:branched-chain amino acid transport system ATP-binding protein